MLKLREITKDYKTSDEVVHALNGVTVSFRKKEFVSILGPSGCGKTTLMNVIGGLDGYTSGELYIDGKSTSDYGAKDWDNYRNKRIGFVFQNYNLIPHLSVLKNVEMALTLSGVSPEARKKAAKEALEKVGLSGQEKKRPNQLSGGQMQRVAIARAIVNAPDVLLADEPTGALDTGTGEQIMDVLKELSADRLVIIVTHNPELAERYSTRIIGILDGKITADSDPYEDEDEAPGVADAGEAPAEGVPAPQIKKNRKDRTAMSFFTALTLSFANLVTKKGRTVLTSIAGSIGIIGISLILALSNGMNLYIEKLTTDTLSGNPITISETAINVDEAMDTYYGTDEGEKYPVAKEILVRRLAAQNSLIASNVMTEEYVSYVKNNIKEELVNDILYETGLEFFIYTKSSDDETVRLQTTNRWQMLVKSEFISTQYDVLDGRLPQNANELLIVVDEYNRLTDTVLLALGLLDGDDESETIPFSAVLGKKYWFLSPDDAFTYDGKKFVPNEGDQAALENGIETTIVGIARLSKNSEMGVLTNGIGYTRELYSALLDSYQNNAVLQYIEDYPSRDPMTGSRYASTGSSLVNMFLGGNGPEAVKRQFGGETTPNDITVYPKDFESKKEIKAILDRYNATHTEEEKITYTDMSELVSRVMTGVVNVISYVLIGFTAISLVVSGVMIGIITYVSVIERTKEIGILRALGARKKDVTRVFNAETFIIGLFAGVFGVSVTGLLTIPINLILGSLAGVYGIASLNVWHALVMIGISVFLTVLSGLIPAVKASRKDPVAALRTE